MCSIGQDGGTDGGSHRTEDLRHLSSECTAKIPLEIELASERFAIIILYPSVCVYAAYWTVRTCMRCYYYYNGVLVDSHKCFGVVTEKDAVFLLDVSISMATHLDSIKDGLSRCLRELPPKLKR